MDERLVELSAKLDDLIEFFDPAIFGRIPSLAGAGRAVQRGAESVAGSVQKRTGSAIDAVRSKLAAASAARAQSRAGAAAAQAQRGGIRDYFGRSSFDRPAASSPTGPFQAMGGATPPPVAAAAPAAQVAPAAVAPVSVPRAAAVNPAIPAPAGPGTRRSMSMPADAPGSQATAAVQAAKQAGAAPWWKNKYAAGAGIAAGAGAAGYLYGSQRQQQMSAWLDDIIQFDRGKYISKNVIDPDPLIGERFKEFLRNVANKRGGKTRQEFRTLLATAGKKTPKIFESAEETIEFDSRPRNEMGQFQPESGGPDPNAMATVYKQPQQQSGGLGRTIAQAGTLAIAGGALGHVGGEIGKAGTSKVKELLKKLRRK
jgi:hypothetical protein